jgi:ParB family transcriptional regulator, chromosome partitioning protein
LLDSKREKLKQKNVITENAFNMPNILANLKTGLDIFQIEIDKLEQAPKDWNFYKDISNEKMFELVKSIKDIGLLHPIVVWEKDDGMYMILSGHSRKRAYDILFTDTKDTKYQKIPCYVKKKDEISEDEAKEIIIDTNWVQRQLSSMEKAKSIFEKYIKIGRKKKSKKGESDNIYVRDIIAKQYKISNRHVSNYYRLNFLIEEFKNLVEQNKISIKSGVKLSTFDENTQIWLVENHLSNLNNINIAKIDTKMSIKEIENVFLSNENTMKFLCVLEIPTEYKKEDFEKALNIFLETYNVNLKEIRKY